MTQAQSSKKIRYTAGEAAHRSRRVGEVAELRVGLQGSQHRVLDLRVAQLRGTTVSNSACHS